MAESIVNENATSYVTVNFADRTGAAETPTTVTWDLHDAVDGTALSTGNSETASTSVTVTVSKGLNNIRHGKRYERRKLTVYATYGGSQRHMSDTTWLVKNLGMVQSTST